MKGLSIKKVLFAITILFLSFSCENDDGSGADEPVIVDDFDRSVMLTNWADNIILPAYNAYGDALNQLSTAVETFSDDVNTSNLVALRAEWLDAYIAWQSVSMFEIGKAEEISLRNFTNIYPADVSEIEENISDGDYNLILSSKNDEQGFPALDYMINGLGDDDDAIVAVYLAEANGEQYLQYLEDISDRLQALTQSVIDDWTDSYRDEFVANSGSSGTSSVNKITNDFLFYYEKSLRAGKIGIPAGIFSGSPLPENVEALYDGEASKALFLAALDATQDFFNGVAFNGDSSGESFQSYLDYLSTEKNGERLSALINGQFDAARTKADNLEDNFNEQVNTNNLSMLETYDELQKNVVQLKVDMLQSLNIKVDFIDADGD